MRKVLAVLFCLAIIAAPVAAQEEPGLEEETVEEETVEEKKKLDRENQGEEQEVKRFVEVRSEEKRIHEIESKTVNRSTGKESKFQIEIRAEETLEIKLKNEREEVDDEVKGPGNISEVTVVFDRLVEYIDENENGVYDRGEPDFTYELEGYRPFTSSNFTQDNDTVHRLTATTKDGVFQVVFYASGDFAEVGSTVVEPTETKFDIKINNYSFKMNNSRPEINSSIQRNRSLSRNRSKPPSNFTEKKPKIALDMDIEKSQAVEKTEEGTEEIIKAETGGDFQGFVSWKETAQVDGEKTNVNSTTRQESVYLSYGRGNDIIHDPKAGFTPAPASAETQNGEGFLTPLIQWLTALI